MSMVKRSNAQWAELIAKYETSGQTKAEWCRRQGISLHTFRNRVSESRKSRARTGEGSALGWIEVELEESIGNKRESKLETEAEETTLSGKLIIELGKLRIIADAAYPAPPLAALLTELVSRC